MLVFGPHPDDIELGLGATIAKHVDEGYRVALVDLTAAELSSNGSPEQRHRQAAEAARVLGVMSRENLGWADGGIATTPTLVQSAVQTIRRHRPRVIAIPHWNDRHPDHVAASEVLTVAAFRSGLRRFITDSDAWRPDWVCYYFINGTAEPSFVIDVSAHYERKWAALACYRSQFEWPRAMPATIGRPDPADRTGVPHADRSRDASSARGPASRSPKGSSSASRSSAAHCS